jgi:hypothetical protein
MSTRTTITYACDFCGQTNHGYMPSRWREVQYNICALKHACWSRKCHRALRQWCESQGVEMKGAKR